MLRVPFLLAAALPLAAWTPIAAPAAAPAPALVVELDRCRCESTIMFEPLSPDTVPWLLMWTTDEGHQDGHCQLGSCSEAADPRPCKGQFRIEVTWPQCPTPPCVTGADVSYRPEGTWVFDRKGTLDVSHTFIPIKKAGGNIVLCVAESQYDDPIVKEPDEGLSMIGIVCGKEGGLTHYRYINVRECCIPCLGPVQ